MSEFPLSETQKVVHIENELEHEHRKLQRHALKTF